MKKFLLPLIFIISLVLLSGCKIKQPDMKTPVGEKQEYNYRNNDLGFELMLPSEFMYYQTQRKQLGDYTDLEIFVPTNDTKYPQEVPSYAKAVVVRIYNDKSYWDGMKEDGDERKMFKKMGERNGKVYSLNTWSNIPSDWKDKWKSEMKDRIEESFKIK